MIVLSTRSSICIRKEIFTKFPARNPSIDSPLSTSSRFKILASGGLISITFPSIVESEVAADPIIWFIASEMALK